MDLDVKDYQNNIQLILHIGVMLIMSLQEMVLEIINLALMLKNTQVDLWNGEDFMNNYIMLDNNNFTK
jgi:hypothetical protein